MTRVKGYYKTEILNKFNTALRDAAEMVKAGLETRVRISHSNSKMGSVSSVSLVPFLTCPARCKGSCGPDCYAAKIANLRPTVLKSYAINTALAIYKPDLFWMQVNAAVMAVRYFRFHVSGDILNNDYFQRMIDTAWNNPKTEILVFTKQFEIVNKWVEENGTIPENLHILFSGWKEMLPDNPYNFPETNVIETEENCSWCDLSNKKYKMCGGNCFNCACRGLGCWQAAPGETIIFKKH